MVSQNESYLYLQVKADPTFNIPQKALELFIQMKSYQVYGLKSRWTRGLHYCIYLWYYMILLSLDSDFFISVWYIWKSTQFINWAKNCGLWLSLFLSPLIVFDLFWFVQIEHWPFIMLNPFTSNTVLLILTSSIILCELRCLGCHSDLITHYDHCVYLSKISVLSNIVPVILIGYHSIAIRQVGFIIVSPIPSLKQQMIMGVDFFQ